MFTVEPHTRLRRAGDAVRGVSAHVTTHRVMAPTGTVEREFYTASAAAEWADALNDCPAAQLV